MFIQKKEKDWEHVTFEGNQKVNAFWEWGMGNWEWVHSIFLQRFDTPNKTDVLPKNSTLRIEKFYLMNKKILPYE